MQQPFRGDWRTRSNFEREGRRAPAFDAPIFPCCNGLTPGLTRRFTRPTPPTYSPLFTLAPPHARGASSPSPAAAAILVLLARALHVVGGCWCRRIRRAERRPAPLGVRPPVLRTPWFHLRLHRLGGHRADYGRCGLALDRRPLLPASGAGAWRRVDADALRE